MKTQQVVLKRDGTSTHLIVLTAAKTLELELSRSQMDHLKRGIETWNRLHGTIETGPTPRDELRIDLS